MPKKTDIPPLKLKEPDPTSQKLPLKNSNQPLHKMNHKPAPAAYKDQPNKENPSNKPESRAQTGLGMKSKNKPHKIFKVIRDSNRGLLYKPVQTKNNKQIKIQAPKIDDVINFFMDKAQQEQPSEPIDLQNEVSKFQERKKVFFQSLSSEFLYPPNLNIPKFVVSNSSQINGEKVILPSINTLQYVESIYREFKLEIEERAKEFKKANINNSNEGSLSTTAVNSIKSESISLEGDICPSRPDVDLSAIVTPFGAKKEPESLKKEEKQAKIVKKIFSIKSEPPRLQKLDKIENVIIPTIRKEQISSLEENQTQINRKDLKKVVEKTLEVLDDDKVQIKAEKIIKKSKSEKVSPKAIQKETKKNKNKLKRKNRKPFVSKWDVTSNRRLNRWQMVQTDKDENPKTRLEESRPAIRPTRKAKTRVENFKKIPVGSNHQVQIPPLQIRKAKRTKTPSRELKVLWEPENMKKKSLEYYFKKLQETYGFYPNEQKAIKLLRENGYELKKVWKEVEAKEAEYSRLFRLKLTRDRGLYFY